MSTGRVVLAGRGRLPVAQPLDESDEGALLLGQPEDLLLELGISPGHLILEPGHALFESFPVDTSFGADGFPVGAFFGTDGFPVDTSSSP